VFDWERHSDISVLKLLDNRVFELATMGISLAGDDIDNELARAVIRVNSKSAVMNGHSIYGDP